MGSGHFLVGACAYIAQYIATDPSYGGSLSLEEIHGLWLSAASTALT